jgi:integrase/recombinase XerD
MFEEIFKYGRTLARHQEGPLSEERIRYLTVKAEGGASLSTLVSTANYMLAIAIRMGLTRRSKVSVDQIERAARSWAHRKTRKNPGASIQGRRRGFRRVAYAWFRFLNWLIPPQTKPEPYEELVIAFAESMDQERGLSRRTIATCGWCARRFLRRLVAQGCVLRQLRVGDVEETISWQASHGFSRRSLRFYVQAVRTFLRYAEQRNWSPCGIAAAIVAPRVYREEKLPSGPSWPDVLRLIASTETNRPNDIRDRAILLLLAIYALRIDEVRQLQLEDIDWEHEQLLIRRSKQRRPRIYPLSPSVAEAIIRYLREVRPRCKDRTLFLRLRAPLRAFTAGGLWPIVGRRLRKFAIVVEHPGPHALRHACATHLMTMGVSLEDIGGHLGHSSADVTHIYAKVDLAGLREVANFDLGGLL